MMLLPALVSHRSSERWARALEVFRMGCRTWVINRAITATIPVGARP